MFSASTSTWDTRHEKIPTLIYADEKAAATALAAEIRGLIERENDSGNSAVLGLAAGSTSAALDKELIRLHREEGLSFKGVSIFNLDEYYGLPRVHPRSHARALNDRLLTHIDIPEKNIHFLDGFFPARRRELLCARYEQRMADVGGIGLQVLGIGRSGHIGFNEPGATKESLTRRVVLNWLTRGDALREFGHELFVPHFGMTMGVATILRARRIVLMAWGRTKASVVARAIEGPVTEDIPASFLQEHPDARFILDTEAASRLERFRLEVSTEKSRGSP